MVFAVAYTIPNPCLIVFHTFKGPGGAATGTDADPVLAYGSHFFASCIGWFDGPIPDIPNSVMLDAVRGFNGC